MSQDTPTLLLAHHLKALKLPTFLRDYVSVAATCSQERSSYPQYLLQLAERELIDRERRATERRIREAAFPVLKTIETFDFGAQPSINEPLVRELLRGEYLAKRENVLLVGNPGTGKTPPGDGAGLCRLHAGQARALPDHHGPGDTTARSTGHPHGATPAQATGAAGSAAA